jgi:hypothetical protein
MLSRRVSEPLSYPGPADAAVEHYWSLHPLRFTEVEWLELRCPVPWTGASGTTLRIRLRDARDAAEALLLEFEWIGSMSLHTQGIVQVSELTIVSIADRGWEYERYAVDTPGDEQLHFYCRRFSATLVPVSTEPDWEL